MPGLLCFVIDGLHTETLASVRTPHTWTGSAAAGPVVVACWRRRRP